MPRKKKCRELPSGHALLGNLASASAEIQLGPHKTRDNTCANIANFLRYLDAAGETLPVNAGIIKSWTVALSNMGYTGIGGRRYHVWKWLQTPPPKGNYAGLNTTSWCPLRWKAEEAPVRLNGCADGTIMGHIDDVEKECERLEAEHDPEKAPPVLADNLLNAWNSFTTRERGIVTMAAACGVRMHSLYNVLPGDIVCSETNVTCYIRADKLKGSAGRMICLHCACGDWPGNPSHTALCPVHSGYITPQLFPIREKECKTIHAAIGITGHSWRRTLALRLRRQAEKQPSLLSRAKVMQHFGWTDPERWGGYAADLRKWDAHILLCSENAVLRGVLRSGNEKEVKWKWFDTLQALGKVPKSFPVMRKEGERLAPSHARSNGSGATGAKRKHVQIQVDDYGPGPKKTKFGQRVVDAKTPPPSPEKGGHASTKRDLSPGSLALRYLLGELPEPHPTASNKAAPKGAPQGGGAASSSSSFAYQFTEKPPAQRPRNPRSVIHWDKASATGDVDILPELTQGLDVATQRRNIRETLQAKGFNDKNGWRVEVKGDQRTLHLRGMCNKCPCQRREDGTVNRDKRCGVMWHGVFAPGDNKIQVRLNDAVHTNPLIKTIWPWALSNTGSKGPEN